MRVEKWAMVEDAGRGWRRVVASPKPVRIIESEVIRHLVKDGYVVIAAGGGGIPVVADEQGNLSGAAAVIDKDLASAVLAEEICGRPAGDLDRGRKGVPELRQAHPARARLDDRGRGQTIYGRRPFPSRLDAAESAGLHPVPRSTAAARRSSRVPRPCPRRWMARPARG